jgi:DNA-binding transcriptional ArsR family regulator
MHVSGDRRGGGPRLQLNNADLGKLKVSPGWGPFTESLLSLRLLRRRQRCVVGEDWRRTVSGRLRPETTMLLALAPAAPLIDLHTVVGGARSIQEALERLEGAPTEQMRSELSCLPLRHGDVAPWVRAWVRALRDGSTHARRVLVELVREYYECAVEPSWTAMQAALTAEQARCGQTLVKGGLDRLLATLHPKIRWQPPFLGVDTTHVPGQRRTSCVLDGRSLVLVSSIFCLDGPHVLRSTADQTAPDVLIYPAVRTNEDAASLQPSGLAPTPSALERLLGRTKAAALAVVADTCTTSELAALTGVTPPTASHHATVLRDAGLIRTSRTGNAVLHRLTALGAELVRGHSRDGASRHHRATRSPAAADGEA